MDIRKLEYFLAVAETGQVTKAADHLHMAQPPLSQQIKLLEEEMGVKLIERKSKGVKLTEAGYKLRNRAEQILSLVDQTTKEIRDTSKGDRGILSLGIATLGGSRFIMEYIRKFHKRYPYIDYQVWENDVYKIDELLNSGVVEVGITRFPAEKELNVYKAIPLPEEPIVAAYVPPLGDGLSDNIISLSELADKPLIIHIRHESVLKHFKLIGIEPRIICRNDNTRAMLEWANAGIGIALVNRSAVNPAFGSNMLLKEIAEQSTENNPIGLVWMRNRYLSSKAKHFIEMFSNAR